MPLMLHACTACLGSSCLVCSDNRPEVFCDCCSDVASDSIAEARREVVPEPICQSTADRVLNLTFTARFWATFWVVFCDSFGQLWTADGRT